MVISLLLINVSMLKVIFTVLIIAIIYLIIFFSLKIMYKDIKSGGKKQVNTKKLGLEIIKVGPNESLKKGGIVPLGPMITLGRKEDNMLILRDPYCSGHHARIYSKNGMYILEDLESTNGTLLNGEKVSAKIVLKPQDEIKIGSLVLKVIG